MCVGGREGGGGPSRVACLNFKRSRVGGLSTFHIAMTVAVGNLKKGCRLSRFWPIEHKPCTKLLGVHIDEMLTWDDQIKHISSKVSNGLRMLYLARKLIDNQETLKTIYYSLVQPYFDYCDVVWSDCSKTRADKLQKLQNRAARIITRADYSTGAHTICLCSRLLFYSKCTGFTVCFTYSDISLTMYVNQ